MATSSDQADFVLAISKAIQPMLHRLPPEIQGAVLADLLSLFLAGHHPALREQCLEQHVKAVRELIGPSERQIFEQRGGRPEGWGKQ